MPYTRLKTLSSRTWAFSTAPSWLVLPQPGPPQREHLRLCQPRGGPFADRDRCFGRLALHHAKGELPENETIAIESIIGSYFEGRVIGKTKFGPFDAVIPEVSGTAGITGPTNLLSTLPTRLAPSSSRI